MKVLFYILSLFIVCSSLLAQDIKWADEVLGYSSNITDKQFSCFQALGKPSVRSDFGLSECAWTISKGYGVSTDWIHVGFDTNLNANYIYIHENFNPGAIVEIIAYGLNDISKTFYNTKIDQTLGEKGRILKIKVSDLRFAVKSIRIILNKFEEFHQIDAIGISENDINYSISINTPDDLLHNDKPENLGQSINSPYKELAPIITADGKRIYFARKDHPKNKGQRNLEDIWYSDADSSGEFKDVVQFDKPINNEYANFVVSVTQDGNSLVLGNEYQEDGTMRRGLSISHFNGTNWEFPDRIRLYPFINFSTSTNYFLSTSGLVMFLSFEGEDSYGGHDIYVSFLQIDGSWSKPINLGPSINTASDDSAPFLASDNETLYFTSMGHPGYGSSDLFVSRRIGDSWFEWSEPQNLGPNINSRFYESFYTIPAKGEYAFFVSKENSFGQEDIFRILLPESLRPKKVIMISGRVLNAKTKEPIDAKIIYESLTESKKLGVARSNPRTGEYNIVLPLGVKYGFLAEADGFVSENQNIDLSKADLYNELTIDLNLVPIEHGQKVRLNNIFFDYGQHQLLLESYNELARVNDFLAKNPDIKIEIQGHTDNIGSKWFNKNLSELRANSVKEYLIKKGISENKISVIGFGESKPIADNSTDEGRLKNRRVEFVIISD